MQFSYLTNLPLAEAQSGYLAFLKEAGLAPRTETVPVRDALSRITAKAVYAALCSPHYNASAMDGIALDARRTFGATETTPVRLTAADFTPVDTGDPLPDGCDAVIMIEDVIEQADGSILLYGAAAPWQHVRQIGEDICAGDMILPSYARITPAAMAAMLAGGAGEVPVTVRPKVGILPTGDEIVPPSSHPAPGEIMEFNSTLFSGMLREWGALPVTYPITKDDPTLLSDMLGRAVAACDAVLVCAGTSAGRDDYTTRIIQEHGALFAHGIAIRPGKPAALGRVGNVPVLGVPGYPVSGALVLEELFRPVVDELLCAPPSLPPEVPAVLTRPLNSSLKYREFIRARAGLSADGTLIATPLARGAGVVTSLVKADAVLDVPQNAEGVAAGEAANARLLRPLWTLQNTLSVVGSHDPLLDEAADLLRRENRGLAVSSTHVGSTGALLAVRRGEAVMGGTHLLDPETGIYNVRDVSRVFPDGGAALVECVYRTQGLMVRKGNPKHLSCIADLGQNGLSYVNRQRGAGTRILLDCLLAREGITPEAVHGYAREETTHTAVAAQIAAGTADAGLGILSAARIYDLDFIPVCEEQYDLLIREDALETPLVQAFLRILQSEAFSARLAKLGGYRTDHPGRRRPL